MEMIQYSDSSEEEEGPAVTVSSQRSGRGFERALPLETKANVRFRYSRGAAVDLAAIVGDDS